MLLALPSFSIITTVRYIAPPRVNRIWSIWGSSKIKDPEPYSIYLQGPIALNWMIILQTSITEVVIVTVMSSLPWGGVPKKIRVRFKGPHNKDLNISGSVLGALYLWKAPCGISTTYPCVSPKIKSAANPLSVIKNLPRTAYTTSEYGRNTYCLGGFVIGGGASLLAGGDCKSQPPLNRVIRLRTLEINNSMASQGLHKG